MIGEAFQLTHKGLNNIFAGKNTTLTFAQIEEKANVVPFEQVFRLYAQKECKNELTSVIQADWQGCSTTVVSNMTTVETNCR